MIERLKDPDFREALPYFLVGAAKGIYHYYVQPELTAKRGWMALTALVIAHDVASPKGNSLSEGVDHALETNRLITTLAVGYTAAHLLNYLPEKVDIFHQALKAVKG